MISIGLTVVIGLTTANLAGSGIVGRTVPFAYPWRLTAWSGNLLFIAFAYFLRASATTGEAVQY